MNIIKEVQQTGTAMRYGKPLLYVKAYGVRFYYDRRLKTTFYGDTTREAQIAAKG